MVTRPRTLTHADVGKGRLGRVIFVFCVYVFWLYLDNYFLYAHFLLQSFQVDVHHILNGRKTAIKERALAHVTRSRISATKLFALYIAK